MPQLDRSQAGRELADRLANLRVASPLVLLISAGGARIGWEIARRLGAPMDVLLPRVVREPTGVQGELGVVAGGRFYPDRTALCEQHVPMEYAEELAVLEVEMEMVQEQEYRGDAPKLELTNQTAIAVDDGTQGAPAVYAAVEALHRLGVAEVIYAAPSCTPGVSARIDHDVRLITLCPPEEFRSVTLVDSDFPEATAEEAARLIAQSRMPGWSEANAQRMVPFLRLPWESARREMVEV